MDSTPQYCNSIKLSLGIYIKGVFIWNINLLLKQALSLTIYFAKS